MREDEVIAVVPSINLAREVFERMHAGEFTWEKDFKNLHPSPFGQKLYAASVERLFVVSGPDAGIVEWSVDGAALQTRDLATPWSPQLHLPWTVMLAPDLTSGPHVLKLRTLAGPAGRSTWTACRIVHFLVNE